MECISFPPTCEYAHLFVFLTSVIFGTSKWRHRQAAKDIFVQTWFFFCKFFASRGRKQMWSKIMLSIRNVLWHESNVFLQNVWRENVTKLKKYVSQSRHHYINVIFCFHTRDTNIFYSSHLSVHNSFFSAFGNKRWGCIKDHWKKTIFTPTTKRYQHTSQLSPPTEPYSQH